MGKLLLREVAVLFLTAALLAACVESVSTTASPAADVSPTAPCPSSGEITKSSATPQPADVLLELAWEGGFTRPELAFAFGRVPEFSLLLDGSVYYIDPPELDKSQVMVAHPTPTETNALVQHVLDLGFEEIVITEMDCLDPEGIMEQERHHLDLIAAVTGYHIFGDQLWLETSDRRALIFITEVSQ